MKRLSKGRKSMYTLSGGPLDRVAVALSTPSTIVFSLRGERGSYKQGPRIGGKLVWVAEERNND